MKLGFTTNIFDKELKDKEVTLQDIVDFARENEFEAVELREGCVEDYDGEALRQLTQRYENIHFTYAIKNNCFDEGDEQKVRAAIKLSTSLSAEPILRLVADGEIIKNEKRRYTFEEKDKIVDKLKTYTDIASGHRVMLGLENAREPMEDIKYLVGQVGSSLMGVTFDPGNLTSIAIEKEDPLKALESLKVSEIKLVHLKQTINGEPQTRITQGDIDIKKLLDRLHDMGYEGIICLEPKPAKGCRDGLKSSIEYMNKLYGKSWPYF
ncbi:MAG: sugar phosphate isomerase/epimerase [Elusimicrobiota bacterium]|nr:sugar phosphate isomerase/epimerase [Elusimicrobiota bacterium]MDH5661373.1 sugar phosphate isomerase/epimerase [Elusimicrobiota bacterium]